jgi:protein-S-isoprenylcysteine O-methyltransferase Ste14
VSEENDHAAVRVPPPVVGVLTILSGFGLGWFFPLVDGFGFPSPARYWIGGTVCIVAILVLAIWPIRLFQNIEQDPKPWTSTPEIIVEGPYKFTRNPMYVMMLLVCIGFAIILAEVWILILTPVCGAIIYFTAIRHEEEYLEEKFGDDYREYKKNVRRWI